MLPFKIHYAFIVRTVNSFLNPQPFITLTLCLWGGTHVHVKQLVAWVLPCVSGMAPVSLDPRAISLVCSFVFHLHIYQGSPSHFI